MKYLFLFITSSLLIMSFKSSDPSNETSKLYQQSLLVHLSTGEKTDTVYIFKCFDIDLPSKVGIYEIIDISDNPKFFLKNKKGLYVIKLMPIEVNKGNIEICVIDYAFEEKNEEVMMAYAGSEVFVYKYNSKSKQYKLVDRKRYTI